MYIFQRIRIIVSACQCRFEDVNVLLACQEVSDCESLYHVMMWMCVDCTCVCVLPHWTGQCLV